MTFSTQRNKLFRIFTETNRNSNIIVFQRTINKFLIDGVSELNRVNNTFSRFLNFTSDWITPNTIVNDDGDIEKNQVEFIISFNQVNELFIPYIHGEVVYRFGESGIIPLNENNEPFDEALGNNIKRNEIFQINANSVDYITGITMEDNPTTVIPDIQYKLICYLFNPIYMSD